MITPKVLYELEVAYGSSFGDEEANALNEVLKRNAPSCGKKVKEFEDTFSRFCNTSYAAAVTSATTGLTLSAKAIDLKPSDKIITTPISWIATASAFSTLGAEMIFCDVDSRSLNMDPSKLEALITPSVKAIVPVHLYGQCCRMEEIMKIAGRYGISVIEDCAHNPGGSYKGVMAGNLGDIGVFSFHQQKNMSTLGEGGMVTTSNKLFFDRIISYRSLCCRIYGPSDKYLSIDESKNPMNDEYWKLQFDDFGYNFRMTDAQAAVGLEQLKKLNDHNRRRQEIARILFSRLDGIKGLELPWEDPDGEHVFHLFVVKLKPEFRLSKRELMYRLYTEKGIKVWSHYMPIHLTEPYLRQGHKPGECPVAEEAFSQYVSLPVHPRLSDEAVNYMADSIIEMSR